MQLEKIFEQLEIPYHVVYHEPIYTAADAKNLKKQIAGIGCKNLFLTNTKRTIFLLVMIADWQQADLKEIAKFVGSTRLSFAKKEDMIHLLGVNPGSVSPLTLINDEDKKVDVLIGSELIGKKLLVHPNDNCQTLAISYDHLIKFIEASGHSASLITI